ncbi:DUF5009 domain-containing protein [Undibacterium sp. LX40W]|uniref:DUF5009 domain-containing protein n=1 Tax=Undibacterium nitidum TaxID=2762298 RepID=A0A923KMS0_9BURK|nr:MULTISPECIES: DUF5009 domain-containing protein [Undibacterium]MBC3883200.1 DUF5009 domain-containing protein [Undibacterium nitidum]MBC3893482.1 DUF5009 domain-containing protein [Undibacterium sp. LX40W]
MITTQSSDSPIKSARILSIDAFRGITFFLMVIVNELHGISGISAWLKHMPAEVDAMSFPDVVFPAFLFIVGMSIPFGIKTRISRGETSRQIIQHIFARALALITMGLFMVNAESGFDESKMLIPIATWSMLSYLAFMMIWGVYRFDNPVWNRTGKLAGMLLLLILAACYRGDQNNSWMSVQWWGILGLIGWAYLLSSLIFLLNPTRIFPLLIAILICTVYYALSHSTFSTLHLGFRFLLSQDAHAAHTTIVLSGLVCSMIFFDGAISTTIQGRFIKAVSFACSLALSAALLRPYFAISKIYATPSWCFYSAAICVGFFSVLYYLIDLKKLHSWISLFEPAAVNPLVCYLIPFIVEAIYGMTGWHSPLHQLTGAIGILACVLYAAFIFTLVAVLNRFNFKMRF